MTKLLLPTLAIGILFSCACSDVSADPPKGEQALAKLFGTPIPVSQIEPSDAYVEYLVEENPGKKAEELKLKSMAEFLEQEIFSRLLKSFAEKNKLGATEAEVDSVAKALAEVAGDFEPESPDGRSKEELELEKKAERESYRDMVIQWKTDKALYEKYGGTVIFQQSNPFEPVGAYRKLIEDAEKDGSFEVLDPRLPPLMWSYFKREDHPFQLPKEKIDFSKPWWLNRPPDSN